jgi:hypothetical protein
VRISGFGIGARFTMIRLKCVLRRFGVFGKIFIIEVVKGDKSSRVTTETISNQIT